MKNSKHSLGEKAGGRKSRGHKPLEVVDEKQDATKEDDGMSKKRRNLGVKGVARTLVPTNGRRGGRRQKQSSLL